MGIGPANEKNRVVSLPPTAPPLMVDVNVKKSVDENANASGVELRHAVDRA